MNLPDQTQRDPTAALRRAQAIALFVGVVFLVIAFRLFQLQVIQGKEFREKSLSNFVHFKRIEHDRGQIVDREGRVLVTNRPSTNVYLTPAFLPPATSMLTRLGRACELSDEEIGEISRMLSKAVMERGSPILLARDLSEETVQKLRREAHRRLDLPHEALPIIEMQGGQTYAAYVDPAHFPSVGRVLNRLQDVMGLDEPEVVQLKQRIVNARGLNRYLDILVRRDVSTEVEGKLELERLLGRLPGVFVRKAKARRYEHEALAAHLLGYVNELSAEELNQGWERGYRLGDVVGRRGVEQAFEDELRGEDGRETLVVDSRGLRQRTEFARQLKAEVGEDEPARAGNRVVLTIDLDLQRAAEEAFDGRAGSVVVLEVHTGRILAVTSTPTYNPAKVSGTFDEDEKVRLREIEALRPWRFRAIQDYFAPGSTFKVVTALAALKHHETTGTESVRCPGAFHLGSARFRCWKDAGHGPVDLVNSIAKSCDVFYYTMGARMGLDPIADMALELGFGQKTGIALGGESAGIIPTKAWYNQRRRGSYTLGAAVNASIGQGAVASTPLQLAVAYAALANGGIVYQPQVALRIESSDDRAVRVVAPVVVRKLDVAPQHLKLVQEGLREVVNEPHGTAYAKRLRELQVSGKTGTAQVARLGAKRIKAQDLEWKLRDHAWFAAFAPSEAPEIVVVVFVEHGGGGSSAAAPIAMRVISAWWNKRVLAQKQEAGDLRVAADDKAGIERP